MAINFVFRLYCIFAVSAKKIIFLKVSLLMFLCFGQATDGDEPNTPNSQIVYGIVSSTYSKNFTIDPETGVLTNHVELDREALDPMLEGEIKLVVTATDQGEPPLSTNVTVTINVQVGNLAS